MVYCLLFTVYGLMFTVLWFTVYCLWFTVYCLLFTVYGLLFTVYCLRFMVKLCGSVVNLSLMLTKCSTTLPFDIVARHHVRHSCVTFDLSVSGRSSVTSLPPWCSQTRVWWA